MAKKFDRIYIELTNICNFSCPFCSSVKRAPHEMTVDEVLSILLQAAQWTGEVCLHVLGEPLLYSELDRVLDGCKSRGLKVNLVTNGYFVADRLELLLQYADVFKKISFSMHSYIYHQSDMLGKLTDIVSSSVALSNVGVQIELRNLANSCDESFTASLTRAIKCAANVDLLDARRNQKIKDKLFYVVKKPFEWPDKTKDCELCGDTKGKMYCLGGKTHIAILSDMTVVPCCLDTAGEIALGNLKEQSLQDILHSDKFMNLCKDFTNGKSAHTLCATCKYSQR